MSKAGIIVLVTGASGFVGSHCVNKLLQQGYSVRATVRDLDKASKVKKQVLHGTDPNAGDRLKFYKVDLMSDEGWEEAFRGSQFVFHVASPFPAASPKDENDVIHPAVEGTQRAIRFAKKTGVQRVILTSSFAAIGYGHGKEDRILDETVWTDTKGPGVGAYVKSKALAEQAAWRLANEAPKIEMVSINPVPIYGPILPGTKDLGSSISVIQQIISGRLPASPLIKMGIVDVRDVADMHIKAIEIEEAKGHRFLAVSDGGQFFSIQEIGEVLGTRIRTLPDWLIRCLAPFSGLLKAASGELGLDRKSTNAAARTILGIDFSGWKDTIRITAESLRTEGLAK